MGHGKPLFQMRIINLHSINTVPIFKSSYYVYLVVQQDTCNFGFIYQNCKPNILVNCDKMSHTTKHNSVKIVEKNIMIVCDVDIKDNLLNQNTKYIKTFQCIKKLLSLSIKSYLCL